MTTMSGGEKFENEDLGYWNKRWNTNNVHFHRKDVQSDLVLYESQMLPQLGSIFFPLCGKTVDMAYLASKGHKVVGLEFVASAVEDFFKESGLAYDIIDIDAFKVYKCKDPNMDLSIFMGDINNATSKLLGQFDAIWDRGSLVAINPMDREKYAELITSLMKEGSQYFLISIEYDVSKFGGPPYCITSENVSAYFGQKCEVTQLKHYSIMSPRYAERGLCEVYAALYNLTKKILV